MSMCGFVYCEERYEARMAQLQEDALAALEEADVEGDVEKFEAALGYNLTAQEQAVAKRAAQIAAQEAAEEQAAAHVESVIKLSASAPATADLEDTAHEAEAALAVSDDEALPTNADSDVVSPHAKRIKIAKSPVVPRSPEALRDALEEAQPVVMMEIDDESPVVLQTRMQEQVQISKDKIQAAQESGGDAAGLEVKQEEVARFNDAMPTPQTWQQQPAAELDITNDSAVPSSMVDLTIKPVTKPQPAPKPKPAPKQPEMTIAEMESLYMQVRKKKLQWTPDEEGFYMVLVFDASKPIKIDGTVPQGSGKTCQHSLGARHPTAMLKWVGPDGEYAADMPSSKLMCPCVFHNLPMDQLVSMQSISRDYVPSKKDLAQVPYLDTKIVKFDKPRNRAPFDWLCVDTKATTTVSLPVRMWDCDYFIEIGAPILGSYPLAFKEYCVKKDQQLIEMQNKLIIMGDNFSYLNELNLLMPTPVEALQNWSQHSEATIEEVVGRQAAIDIVDEEEAPHIKGKKKAAKDVKVPRRVYDDVVRNLPPKRKLVAQIGSLLMGKAFELPMVPLNIGIEDPKNKQHAPPVTGKRVGRQPGQMQRVAAPPTARATRASAPPPAPPPPPKPTKGNKGINTANNAAANTVTGGQPVPRASHPMPPHLEHLLPDLKSTAGAPSPHGSQSQNSDGSSLQSAAITEFKSQLCKITKSQDEVAVELKALRSENKELSTELLKVRNELAAKDAALSEVRKAKEEQIVMHQQWTAMCSSMLGTIEAIKK